MTVLVLTPPASAQIRPTDPLRGNSHAQALPSVADQLPGMWLSRDEPEADGPIGGAVGRIRRRRAVRRVGRGQLRRRNGADAMKDAETVPGMA